MKEAKVGTGITRHTRQTWGPNEHQEFDRFLAEHDYIDPKKDFVGWLDRREQQIAKALEHFKLPAPNRCVVSDDSNPKAWQYDDDWTALGKHQRTEWYLQNFPYQSSFWYYGRILFFIHQCRLAIISADWLSLAGCSLELGNINREMHLKFSGEKRLRDFERHDARHVAGTDKGNATKREVADTWRKRARRIAEGNPATDWFNISQVAADVMKAWPQGVRKPGDRSLRGFLSDLAKRHVLP
jgi:hypothetical protein